MGHEAERVQGAAEAARLAATAEAGGKLQAEAAKLGEYRSLLKAQSGKAVTKAYAQVLIKFSYGL